MSFKITHHLIASRIFDESGNEVAIVKGDKHKELSLVFAEAENLLEALETALPILENAEKVVKSDILFSQYVSSIILKARSKL